MVIKECMTALFLNYDAMNPGLMPINKQIKHCIAFFPSLFNRTYLYRLSDYSSLDLRLSDLPLGKPGVSS